MRTPLLFILCALCATTSFAQADKARLMALAYGKATPDKVRLVAMDSLANAQWLPKDPDSLIVFSQRMVDLARKLGDRERQASGYVNMSIGFWQKGTIDDVDSLNSLAEELLGPDSDPDRRAGLLVSQGLVLASRGLQAQAKDKYREAIVIYQGTNNRDGLSGAESNLASILAQEGDLPAAVEAFTRSLQVAEQMQDSVSIGNVLSNLGSCNTMLGNLPQARAYFLKAVDVFERIGYSRNLPRPLINLGFLYIPDSLQMARVYAERALVAVERSGEISMKVGYYNLMSRIFLAEQQPDSALYQMRLAEELSVKGNDAAGSLSMQLQMAGVLYGLGRLEEAIAMALTVLDKAREMGLTPFQFEATSALKDWYKQSGQFAKALEMYEQFVTVQDSLRNEENQRKTIQQEFAYTYGKQALADSLEFANERVVMELGRVRTERSRNIYLSVGVLALVLALGLWTRLRFTTRARREADALRQRAESSEKFKQQFLANMSHEIRTPMNAIMGMTGILKRNERLPDQQKYLDAIAESSQNLLVIINDILDLSKLEAGKIDLEEVPMDLRKVIGGVRDTMRYKAEEKGIAMHMQVDPEVPALLIGDPTRLNQILLNLTGNAVKFTEQGSVTITAAVRERSTDRCTLAIDITDTGIGIPADRLDKIFEEFTQAYGDTTRKYGGTGLGLTISKQLAEMQGGGITVRSERGMGSTFTLTIPYAIAGADAEPAQDIHTGSTAASTALQNLRVLLAEDNDFNAMVAQDELADAIPGVQVDVAANGAIAVHMAQAERYDVILMDVQMPEMNGYQATRAIRALDGDRSRVPIIAMTANVMRDEVERCREAGMDGHIPKPFKRAELVEAIASAMAIGAER